MCSKRQCGQSRSTWMHNFPLGTNYCCSLNQSQSSLMCEIGFSSRDRKGSLVRPHVFRCEATPLLIRALSWAQSCGSWEWISVLLKSDTEFSHEVCSIDNPAGLWVLRYCVHPHSLFLLFQMQAYIRALCLFCIYLLGAKSKHRKLLFFWLGVYCNLQKRMLKRCEIWQCGCN